MAILRADFVAILLVCAASASRSLESARDQYKAQEDIPHPPQLLSKATDRPVDVQQPLGGEPGRTSPFPVYSQSSEAPEGGAASKQANPQKIPRKRSIGGAGLINFGTNYYSQWGPSVSPLVPPLSTYSIWRPQYYQIQRPYFIPVWGSPGRIPLYFPPQPLYVNPGYPADNPPKNGYLPPDPNRQYLPPYPSQDNSTDIPLIDKAGDGGPVWDAVTVPTTVKPTRRTRPPGRRTTTVPSLVHNPEDASLEGNQISPLTTTARPPPPRPRPTQAPAPPPAQGKQPSRCVWAIVSCCSTESEDVSYRCFEQLGCTGAFWDASPCQSDFARAAIANVMNYYEAK